MESQGRLISKLLRYWRMRRTLTANIFRQVSERIMSTDLPIVKIPASHNKLALKPVGGTIRSLQHLRVLAASIIVLYHTELQIMRLTNGQHPHSLGFGAAGTDLFFAIGGFILVYTSYKRKGTFGAFLYRRMARIAPLYWLFTFLMLVALLVAPSHLQTTKVEFWHFLLSLLFIPYPHPVLGLDRPFLFPGWVLNHFVFFYVLFGALLFLPTGRRVLLVSAVLCTLMALKFLFAGESNLLDFYGATVALDFVLGMIVAWLFLERQAPLVMIVAVFLTGASIFAAGVAEGVSDGSERALYWGVAGASLLFVCVFIEKQWGWPNWRFLSALGDASYSVFVSHLFALALVTSIMRELHIFPVLGITGTRIAFLGAAWTLGMLVYMAIERPLMRRIGWQTKERPAGSSKLVLANDPDASISSRPAGRGSMPAG
jgi:peptidoglycan/LPS O-acetylase OafA/YrhL